MIGIHKRHFAGLLVVAAILWTSCFSLPVYAENEESTEVFFNSHAQTSYYLKNAYSGLYLDVLDGKDGTQPVQKSFTGEASQRFFLPYELRAGGGPGYSIVSTKDTTLYFTVENREHHNAVPIKMSKITGWNDQGFSIYSTGNDTWRIQRDLVNPQVLEVAGPSKKENAPVQTWEYIGAKNQQWILEPAEPVLMLVTPYSPTSKEITQPLNLKIINNTDKEIHFGQAFKLEKYMAEPILPGQLLDTDKWEPYYQKEKIFWELFDRTLEPKDTLENFATDLSKVTDQKLTRGLYRIVREFDDPESANGDLDDYTAYGEFWIYG